MDAADVYLTYNLIGDRREGGEVVTDVHVTPYGEEGIKYLISFASYRSAGYGQKVYHAVSVEEGTGFTDIYDLEWMRSARLPVKRRYERLTLANFKTLAQWVDGYERIIAEVKTDDALRGWYREAILG